MNIDRLELTPQEEKWADILIKDGKILNEMEQYDKTDKKELQITRKFVEFITMIINQGNLKGGLYNYERARRLVRVHKSIPTKILDFKKYEYIIFNGLYLVSEVIFVEEDICKKFFRKPYPETKIELGMPEDLVCHTIRYINQNGKIMGVGLAKSDLTDTYVRFQSNWSYPIF